MMDENIVAVDSLAASPVGTPIYKRYLNITEVAAIYGQTVHSIRKQLLRTKRKVNTVDERVETWATTDNGKKAVKIGREWRFDGDQFMSTPGHADPEPVHVKPKKTKA